MRTPLPSTRLRVLDRLRRRGPATASELADAFGLSSMAVRSHLAALRRDGLVQAGAPRRSRGRPAATWRVTPLARHAFEQRSGAMALEVLAEMEVLGGRDAVVAALERRAARLAATYAAALRNCGPAERVRRLAALRDEEGYVCETESRNGGLPELVEHHCPVEDVARRWPEVCRMEAEAFGRVLGVAVERTEHMLSGGSCCRYREARPV